MPEPRSVVFSADDFGLTESVNEAVEIAHRDGCLTQASLMVAGDAAADAVARAKRLPGLKTGLHLVLVEGASVSGHERLSHITQADGRFGSEQAPLGVRYFFSAAARRELETEIRAQFEAYRATGLDLHHADCHKHMHLHPTVAALMIRVGREFGLRRIRVPAEPPAVLAACGTPARMGDLMLYRWSSVLRRQARRAGLATSDHVFGIRWSGQMTGARITRLLANLPPGSSEIYFHPATRQDGELARLMPDYRHREELDALLSVSR
ncbi:hopanoid biosynthesis-associated protein HpnK [Acidiphilium acidophilum]|uniref:hopanoid biosynthesis-associated protein HpnK n=1 Tax=Acidiphilium acidophilum TaxID=76588 RepID=UPI002E8E624B|nr:hopanoid biosynthesis-associated protein HpnK [Acidiphilium acidophilum]